MLIDLAWQEIVDDLLWIAGPGPRARERGIAVIEPIAEADGKAETKMRVGTHRGPATAFRPCRAWSSCGFVSQPFRLGFHMTVLRPFLRPVLGCVTQVREGWRTGRSALPNFIRVHLYSSVVKNLVVTDRGRNRSAVADRRYRSCPLWLMNSCRCASGSPEARVCDP